MLLLIVKKPRLIELWELIKLLLEIGPPTRLIALQLAKWVTFPSSLPLLFLMILQLLIVNICVIAVVWMLLRVFGANKEFI